VHQPVSYDVTASESSLRSSQLFEVSIAPLSKPFLAAALKAKENFGVAKDFEDRPVIDLGSEGACESSLLASEVFNDISSSSKSRSDGDESSSLCSSELDELDELLDREERGERLTEGSWSKLRDLDFFDRYKEGDDLNEGDMKSLNDFRSRRRKDHKSWRCYWMNRHPEDLSTIIDCSPLRSMLVELVVRPYLRRKTQSYLDWTGAIALFAWKEKGDRSI
jgi:hypothetical protein